MLGLLQVRATLLELARWKRQALKYGLTLSEYVRSALNNAKVHVVEVADPALLAELRRHNNNLNQLLHAHHSGMTIDTRRVYATIDALHAVYFSQLQRGRATGGARRAANTIRG